jgi:DNA-binding beta-propeller fold protein YncE
VQRVDFPAGSEPIMLRVSPDGKYVWVQTYKTNMNYVLDADSMAVMNAIQAGTDPEQSAFQPNGGPYGMIAHLSDSFLLVLDSSTGNEVARIELGKTQANISYTADGAIAFVTSPTGDEVVVILCSNGGHGRTVIDPRSSPRRGGRRCETRRGAADELQPRRHRN